MSEQIGITTKLTPYQKRIEKIESVILCVAAAEKLVDEIGDSMIPAELLQEIRSKSRKQERAGCRVGFAPRSATVRVYC